MLQLSPFASKIPPVKPSDRPLSPHLQIYRPQMTSVLSILHRLTGVGLCGGMLIVAAWLMTAASGPEAYGVFMTLASSVAGKLVFFFLTVCVSFHFASGIRHLIWDAGRLFDMRDATFAGYLVLLFTALMTGAVWFCLLTRG